MVIHEELTIIYAALWLEKYLALRPIKKMCAEIINAFEEDLKEDPNSLKGMETFKPYLNDWKCGKLTRLLNARSCD